MLQYPKGETATFYCTYALIDGSPIDPVSPAVSIWYNSVMIVPNMPLTRISLGYYSIDWLIPMDFVMGEYSALYSGYIQGEFVQGEESFEITGEPTPLITDYYCTWDDVKACLLGLDIGDMPQTLQDRMILFHMPALKQEIDQYCRQNFDKTTVTEFIDGSGTDRIVLQRRPIRQVFNCILRVIPSISWYSFARWRNVNVIDSQGITIAQQGGPEPHTGKYPPYSPGDYNWETTIEKADLMVDCSNGIIVIPPRILYLEMQAIPFWNYTFLRGNKNIEISYEYGYDLTNLPRDLRLASAKLVACQILLLKGISVGAGANSISLDGVSRSFGGVPYTALIEDMRKQAFATLDKFKRIFIG